ncbi:ParB/RepB/Spo0J family partition protein [Crocosphaera sp. XPORK-15E]|uniref:ParB/RepB/Spo0J family partition protein n=1 Tax=Crocosphaera sp. XPORK-15E TaxID=3110247 RepID=UPI002B1F7E24|nr:ParB/RepB/Spo0J family partition protein [Crocosphaera sp. XPORK-15E]MEA5536785.1 ParB/RepB/Spo0J family partition protein [Crocosphaera sp. XPORK-15E]
MTPKSDKPYKAQANLDILFGSKETDLPPQTIKLNAIVLPETQPRRYFDPQKLEQLTESVKTYGILENLLVRPISAQHGIYELVAGERRYRAAIAAQLDTVPVTIRDLTDSEALEIALVENLQREDLNPVEETEAILQLLANHLNFTELSAVSSLLYKMQNLVAKKITDNVISKEQINMVQQVFHDLGRMEWESFVSNRLPLLKLPEEVLEALRQGLIEYTKAKTIARLKNDESRASLLNEAIEHNLSLSEIRQRIKTINHVSETPSTHTQLQSLTHRLNKSKLWEKQPKQWKKIQQWLDKIESILSETENEEINPPSQISSSQPSGGIVDPLENSQDTLVNQLASEEKILLEEEIKEASHQNFQQSTEDNHQVLSNQFDNELKVEEGKRQEADKNLNQEGTSHNPEILVNPQVNSDETFLLETAQNSAHKNGQQSQQPDLFSFDNHVFSSNETNHEPTNQLNRKTEEVLSNNSQETIRSKPITNTVSNQQPDPLDGGNIGFVSPDATIDDEQRSFLTEFSNTTEILPIDSENTIDECR